MTALLPSVLCDLILIKNGGGGCSPPTVTTLSSHFTAPLNSTVIFSLSLCNNLNAKVRTWWVSRGSILEFISCEIKSSRPLQAAIQGALWLTPTTPTLFTTFKSFILNHKVYIFVPDYRPATVVKVEATSYRTEPRHALVAVQMPQSHQ